jgi:hypothetical protein
MDLQTSVLRTSMIQRSLTTSFLYVSLRRILKKQASLRSAAETLALFGGIASSSRIQRA